MCIRIRTVYWQGIGKNTGISRSNFKMLITNHAPIAETMRPIPGAHCQWRWTEVEVKKRAVECLLMISLSASSSFHTLRLLMDNGNCSPTLSILSRAENQRLYVTTVQFTIGKIRNKKKYIKKNTWHVLCLCLRSCNNMNV